MKKKKSWSFVFKIYFWVMYFFNIEMDFEKIMLSEIKLQMFNFVEKK